MSSVHMKYINRQGLGGGKQIYWTNKLVNFEELNEFLSKVLLCNLIKRSRGKIKFACY